MTSSTTSPQSAAGEVALVPLEVELGMSQLHRAQAIQGPGPARIQDRGPLRLTKIGTVRAQDRISTENGWKSVRPRFNVVIITPGLPVERHVGSMRG